MSVRTRDNKKNLQVADDGAASLQASNMTARPKNWICHQCCSGLSTNATPYSSSSEDEGENEEANQTSRRVVLVLTFSDISEQAEEDSDKSEIQRLVKSEILSNCCLASTFLRSEQANASEVEDIQEQVLRFLQVKDKYLALGSVLLKSQAFHLTYDAKSSRSSSIPVVALPRTEFKKPYIPTQITDNRPNDVKEEDVYPLSISHQFPFVGSARVDTSDSDSSAQRPKAGLDIVTFDDYNPRLHSNLQEFMAVFRSSFTAWEWSRIHAENASHLHEFYVRWSIKEAYTKALGVGLGFEFDSFDTRLAGVDDDENGDTSGLWSQISTCPGGISLLGSVVFRKSIKPLEFWDFFFIPLYEKRNQNDSTDLAPARGCACVCAGPFPESPQESGNQSTRYRTIVEWTELEKLAEWHVRGTAHI